MFRCFLITSRIAVLTFVCALSVSRGDCEAFSPNNALTQDVIKSHARVELLEFQKTVAEVQGRVPNASADAQKQVIVDAFCPLLEFNGSYLFAGKEALDGRLAMIARLKEIAGNEGQLFSYDSNLEALFKDLARDEASLNKITAVTGQLKKKPDNFRAKREARLRSRRSQRAGIVPDFDDMDDEGTHSAEVEARLAEVKKQKKAGDQMISAGERTVSSKERLLPYDAWRGKNKAECAARQANLQHLDIP